jgi:pyruvate kinase
LIVLFFRPNCADVDKVVDMLDAGINVARINFSEGDQKTHGESLSNLASALDKRPDMKCPVMFETIGPEITLECIRDD